VTEDVACIDEEVNCKEIVLPGVAVRISRVRLKYPSKEYSVVEEDMKNPEESVEFLVTVSSTDVVTVFK